MRKCPSDLTYLFPRCDLVYRPTYYSVPIDYPVRRL